MPRKPPFKHPSIVDKAESKMQLQRDNTFEAFLDNIITDKDDIDPIIDSSDSSFNIRYSRQHV